VDGMMRCKIKGPCGWNDEYSYIPTEKHTEVNNTDNCCTITYVQSQKHLWYLPIKNPTEKHCKPWSNYCNDSGS